MDPVAYGYYEYKGKNAGRRPFLFLRDKDYFCSLKRKRSIYFFSFFKFNPVRVGLYFCVTLGDREANPGRVVSFLAGSSPNKSCLFFNAGTGS